MKKLIVVLGVFALISCSKDEDCKYDRAEIEARYEQLLDNDLPDHQRAQIEKEYAARMKEAC